MKITIFSTRTCPYCKMLKSWLDNQKINYTNYNIDLNPIAAQSMINLSGQMGVPFTTIEYKDGSIEKILGFDRERFTRALAED